MSKADKTDPTNVEVPEEYITGNLSVTEDRGEIATPGDPNKEFEVPKDLPRRTPGTHDIPTPHDEIDEGLGRARGLLDRILGGEDVLDDGADSKKDYSSGGPVRGVGKVASQPEKFPLFSQTQQWQGMTDRQRQRARDDQAYAERLADWWRTMTEADINATVPKALEYGSHDLDIMVTPLLALAGDLWADVPDEERAQIGREMAILFYLQGKLGRAISAYQRGMRPSRDTVFDIRIYAVMLQRIFDTGQW